MKRVAKAKVFEFTTYRQVAGDLFAFNFVVHFADGTIEKFTERIKLPFTVKSTGRVTTKMLQQLHIVLGINYYKLYAPHEVKVPYDLDVSAAAFWNRVYRYGLGEFAYLNGLNPLKLGNFKANIGGEVKKRDIPPKFNKSGKYLTGIGGGKDSLVAWNLLEKVGVSQAPFVCESPSHNNKLRREVLGVLGKPALIVERRPDEKLAALRKKGDVYRGHTPMSVVVAFTAVFCAYLKKYDGFLVANESSSNEYNLTWRGIKVNHQWTKTVYFEKAFNAHLRSLGIPVSYLSVVRPMNELMITALFARMPEYHDVFFSCNRSITDKQGKPVKWCGECAKCASATLLLSPFLTPKQLVGIMGTNMLTKTNKVELFAELAGFAGDKPFECVCTKEEAQAILRHLHSDPKYANTPVVRALYETYDDAEEVRDMDDLQRFRPQKWYPKTLARGLERVIDGLLEGK